ncbi:cellulose biosynthesis protein BcsO [Erwinia sp. S38]|uniref:cellulose biosynthesis protein BcsO n=1 Tax=Erwinia sp. S38 TaxID=2769338 RepID=UPI001DB1E5D0|nr:cellulose biosynthesis protein BcsO [Erwinia sp. S38]MBK0001988.1 cellulose biosynthesis protein BcsO [Erwinia sp. S38]
MKSYDDLQRFKEKTQTNHIEFKDMSEQSLHSDSSNWAIIKQLLSDGTDPVLDKSQRIDVVAPQPIDPSVLLAPPVAAAPAQPLPSFSALEDRTPSVGASLFDSISSSLKPGTPPEASAPVTPQPEVPPVAPAKPAVQLTKVADLRPESVAQASGSLFDQLAKSQPNTAQKKPDAPLEQPTAPQLNALLQQQPEPTQPNAQPLLQSGFPLPPPPVQPQLNALLQSPPVAPPPQQVAAPQYQPHPQQVPPQYQPQQVVQQPYYASQQVSPQPLYQSQPPATSPLFASSQAIQPHAQPAATSSNISYKQLFSPAHGSAEQIVSKEMPLQSLLEKIASCR